MGWITAPDLGDRKAEKLHGMQGVKGIEPGTVSA
jgi:hypothetical protein